jgi:hypothetical protein
MAVLMKTLFAFLLTMVISGSLFAQSSDFSFGYKENGIWKPVSNGGTITFPIKKDKILDATIAVRNEQNIKKTFFLKKFYVKRNPLSFMDIFCWDQCYTNPNVMVSVNPVVFQPLTTDSSHLHLTYMPNNNEGETIIRYTVWDKSTPQDSGYVFVHFVATTTAINEMNAVRSFAVSPNPSPGKVTFLIGNPAGPATFVCIFDLVGNELKKIPFPEGKVTFSSDLGDLHNGIYIVRMESPSQRESFCKLMIRH